MRRLLVVRLGSLGDLIHTLPAVGALRRSFPALEIDWLVEAPHRDLLGFVPGLTDVVVLERRTLAGWLDVRRQLQARGYDVAADFQGLVKSAALARLSGARRVVGFDRAALREPAAAYAYSERVPVGDAGHVVDKNLRLAVALGAEMVAPEFQLDETPSPAVAVWLREIGGAYALVNPGAAWPNKRWPPDRFGQLAARIKANTGLMPIVLWGPGEADLADAVVSASAGSAVRAPETRLGDLIAIARGASLMVSGDTGPMHIAAAVGTPIVALFGPTDAARNGPWAADDVTLSRYGECACHYRRRCQAAERWCLATIELEEVVAAVTGRLARTTR